MQIRIKKHKYITIFPMKTHPNNPRGKQPELSHPNKHDTSPIVGLTLAYRLQHWPIIKAHTVNTSRNKIISLKNKYI